MNDGSASQIPGVNQGGQSGQQAGRVGHGQPGALPNLPHLGNLEQDAEMTGHMVMEQTVQAPEATSSLEHAVSLAMDIVARTQNNPTQQAKKIAALKANYLKQGHGVDVSGRQ